MNIVMNGAASEGGSKGLRIGLWVVQVLLALVFGLSGAMKLAVPYAELLKQGAWVERVPEAEADLAAAADDTARLTAAAALTQLRGLQKG